MWILQVRRRPSGSVKTVGGATRADFIVDAALVSRIHCRLTATCNGVEVEDLSCCLPAVSLNTLDLRGLMSMKEHNEEARNVNGISVVGPTSRMDCQRLPEIPDRRVIDGHRQALRLNDEDYLSKGQHSPDHNNW
jgi:hypothetical protein